MFPSFSVAPITTKAFSTSIVFRGLDRAMSSLQKFSLLRNEAHRMRALAGHAAATQRHFLQHAQLDEFVHASAHRAQLNLRARIDLLAREIETRPPAEEIDDLLLLRGELSGTTYLVVGEEGRVGNVG